VLDVVRDLLDEKPNVKVVLVPSLDDVIADHVFPQVSVLLYTVKFYANLAHSLTRSP
jgi:hypothetical protein